MHRDIFMSRCMYVYTYTGIKMTDTINGGHKNDIYIYCMYRAYTHRDSVNCNRGTRIPNRVPS